VFTRTAVAVSGVSDDSEHQAHELQCGGVIKDIRSPEVVSPDVLAELDEAKLDDVGGQRRPTAILDALLDVAQIVNARLVGGVQRTAVQS